MRPPLSPPREAGRTGAARLVVTLTGHGLRAFARDPLAAFFTLGFPLSFFVIIAAILGDQPVEGQRVTLAQFLVAPFAVFGVAQAAFTLLATDTAVLREGGVFARMRGAPVPAWALLAGRIGSAVVVSLTAVVVLVAVGIAGYGVRLPWRLLPAMVVTLLVGVASLAALGLALASLTRTVAAAQALGNGLVISLSFISEVFIVGADLPRWLDWLGSALPLKHFARALSTAFNPFTVGNGFSAGHLAVLAGWGAAGGLVAWRRFGWDARGTRSTPVAPAGSAEVVGVPVLRRPDRPGRRPTAWTLLRGQVWYALTALGRDRLSVFFAVVFPVALLVLFPTVFEGQGQVEGMSLAHFLLPAMAAYGIAVSTYVNLPEGVAQARERGVLKRLRGTPLPPGLYVVGRVTSATLVAAVTVVALLAVAVGFLDVRLDPGRLPAFVVTALLGCACFAALGFAVLALVPSAKSLTAITLGTLLPLGFVSDVFLIGPELPGWLAAIGNAFPLRHLMRGLLQASRPDLPGSGFAWSHLGVLVAWTAAALLVARRAARQA